MEQHLSTVRQRPSFKRPFFFVFFCKEENTHFLGEKMELLHHKRARKPQIKWVMQYITSSPCGSRGPKAKRVESGPELGFLYSSAVSPLGLRHILLWGAIVNRTYGVHKKLPGIDLTIFTSNIFGPIDCGPP